MTFDEQLASSNLDGKIAIVTGANAGLGWLSSLKLAQNGVEVIMGCRNLKKGEDAKTRILNKAPQANIHVMELDLTSIPSIKRFCVAFQEQWSRLDILINNAAVVNLEHLSRTPEGREMHMATNHLGHFALTGLLFPLLSSTPFARVVTVSSGGYRMGTLDFDDFDWHQRPYHRVKSYGDSKLANLVFAKLLQEKFAQSGSSALSLMAHPGLTGTERQQTIGIGGRLSHCLASDPEKGVQPQLHAATAASVDPELLYGPKYGLFGSAYGRKPKLKVSREDQECLWQLSESLTGVSFP